MATMELDLARFFTVAETARCLDRPEVPITEARIRDWQGKKMIRPTLTSGRIQFSRADVTRMFVLGQLQDVFGQVAIATTIALAMRAEDLEALLRANHPVVEVTEINGRTFKVEISAEDLAMLRERMAEVRR